MKIFRHTMHVPLLVLASAEAVVAFCAPWGASLLLHDGLRPSLVAVAQSVTFAAAFVVGSTAMGLYSRRQRARRVGLLTRGAAAVVPACAVAALVGLAWSRGSIHPRTLLLGAGLALLVTWFGRVLFDRLVDEEIFKRRILVFGSGRRAASIVQLRRRADQRGFRLVAFIRTDEERGAVPADRVVDLAGPMLEYCQAHGIEEVVVAMDDRRRAFPVHELLECRLNGIEIVDIVDFLERETGKVRLDVLNPSWIIFSPGFDRSRWRELSKRLFDVAASLVLLIASWPLMLLAVAAIQLEDGVGAPVFYRQQRVGRNGRIFDVLKFRSMRIDAEAPGRAVWAQKQDSRVTRVGGVIRKFRVDELPQIFNVLRGDMSFVGPRPERPEFVAELEDRIPYYRERHCVKPGVTGWAQLCYPYGSSEQDAAEKLQYDLYYIKNHSLWFDMMILLQTVEVVIWGQGAR